MPVERIIKYIDYVLNVQKEGIVVPSSVLHDHLGLLILGFYHHRSQELCLAFALNAYCPPLLRPIFFRTLSRCAPFSQFEALRKESGDSRHGRRSRVWLALRQRRTLVS